jgi:phosphate-selective porin OprO and OprP
MRDRNGKFGNYLNVSNKIMRRFEVKKLILAGFSILALLSANSRELYADNEMRVLVEKGILSASEAEDIMESAKEAARKETMRILAEKGILSASEAAEYISEKQETKRGGRVNVSLDDRGLKFRTEDGNFDMKIGGRIHADILYMQAQSELSDFPGIAQDYDHFNNAGFRRVRLYSEGTVYENFFYKTQFDFSNADVSLKGVYMGMKDIPYIGQVKLGQFKEPMGLERLTSSNNITFMERALLNALAPGWQWGAEISNNWLDRRVTAATGLFRNSDGDSGNLLRTDSNEWNWTSRITALPLYGSDGKELIHLGASYSFRTPDRKLLDLDTRPEMETNRNFVNTGNFGANTENRIGAEAAFVYGPFSLQAELLQTIVDLRNNDNAKSAYFYGVYGYASYFLTGESRNYSRTSGDFGAITPKENFSLEDKTWGAWEIAARYSYLDLDDNKAEIEGGILNNMTLGINWYLNRNLRAMLNYVHTNRNGVGYADGVQARLQVNF